MKRKIEVSHERGIDANGDPIWETVRVFKNEPEAIAFYTDQRNIRRYGTMSMCRRTEDGDKLLWDDRKGEWIAE